MKLLIVDNYDSFTFNLFHYFEQMPLIELVVKRNDEILINEVDGYDGIVLSPGPGLPHEAGIMPQIIAQYHSKKPFLGICLGHQALAEFFGAELFNLSKVYHGISTPIFLKKEHKIFEGIRFPIKVGRYHSWAVSQKNLPKTLEILAECEDETIMSFTHKILPIVGIQFHPESIMTEQGFKMLKNWIAMIRY